MSLSLSKLRQKLYPPEFRISAERNGAGPSVVSLLLAMLDSLEHLPSRQVDLTAPPSVPEPPQSNGQEKGFVIDLCNQIHLLSRSTKKLQPVGGPEVEKLERTINRLRKVLEEHSVQSDDLTGQTFDPGRTDFEPLGEPQVSAGLLRMTIMQCERPVVRLDGKVIQPARGIVGKPAE